VPPQGGLFSAQEPKTGYLQGMFVRRK